MRFHLKKLITLAAILPLGFEVGLPIAAHAQQQQQAVAASRSLSDLGLIYSPLPEQTYGPTFNQLPGAEQAGSIVSPTTEYGYDPSRAWPVNATADQILKIGDLPNNPQFAGITQLRLKDFSQNIGTNIEGIPLKDIELLNGVNLEQLRKLYELDNVKVKDALPAVQIFLSALFDPRGSVQQINKNALSTGAKVLMNKLRKNKALKDVPFERILAGDWQGTILEGEKVLLQEIGDKIPDHLRRLPIGSLTIEVIEQDWASLRSTLQNYAINEVQELTLKELAERFPEIQDIPLSVVSSIANQPLSQSLPKVADYTIEQLQVEDKLISSIPGLSDTPVGQFVGDTLLKFFAGDLFARMDIAYSGQDGPEFHNGRPLTGGTKDQKFKPEPGIRSATSKTSSSKGMPRIEVKPAEGSGANVFGATPLLGKEIMGREQKVPGCKNLGCLVGKWEPAGLKPVRKGPIKFSFGNITEYPDKAFSARIYVDTQVCFTTLFIEHCTPHIISIPTPWKVTRNSLFPILSKRRIQDLFPGLNEQGQLIDACKTPPFLNEGQQISNSASSPDNSQYGHLPYAETAEQLYEVTSVDGVSASLTEDAANAFEQMIADAATQGLDIKAISGFRSVELQQQLFDAQVAQQGSEQAAAKISAPPGHSEHHTGLTVDVGNARYPSLDTTWASTPEYQWMQQNAGKYGFELSFPEGNSQGVNFEPWHWRYVGTDQAAQVFSAGNHTGHSHAHDQGSQTQSTVAQTPDQLLALYLERIKLGESSGGVDTGQRQDTGAAGEYQFIPTTRNTILELYGVDGWSTDPAERDQAAIALIQEFGNEVGTDIIGLIESGNFTAADDLLGKHVYENGRVVRWGQFTSLPGGAEEHHLWRDPAILAQYSPGGDPSKNPLQFAINRSRQQTCNRTLLASNNPGASLGPFQQGDGVTTGQFGLPTEYPVSSPYGQRSLGFHEGIDYATPMGSEIRASDGGVVIDIEVNCPQQGHLGSRCGGGYGNLVFIQHSNGYITVYGHLSATNVQIGDSVKKGQVIALSGNSGKTTGPHLHFEIRDPSSQKLDPANFLN